MNPGLSKQTLQDMDEAAQLEEKARLLNLRKNDPLALNLQKPTPAQVKARQSSIVNFIDKHVFRDKE